MMEEQQHPIQPYQQVHISESKEAKNYIFLKRTDDSKILLEDQYDGSQRRIKISAFNKMVLTGRAVVVDGDQCSVRAEHLAMMSDDDPKKAREQKRFVTFAIG